LRTVPVVAWRSPVARRLGAARSRASSLIPSGQQVCRRVFISGPAIVAPLGENLDKEGLRGCGSSSLGATVCVDALRRDSEH